MNQNTANIQRAMPSNIWTGTGMPSFTGPATSIKQMRNRRIKNTYKLVRRSDKWVVRVKYNGPFHVLNDDIIAKSGAYCIKPDSTQARTWEWKYLYDVRQYDFDFWFYTRGEAIMFMLRSQ